MGNAAADNVAARSDESDDPYNVILADLVALIGYVQPSSDIGDGAALDRMLGSETPDTHLELIRRPGNGRFCGPRLSRSNT
ncbi:hypothetical protein [Bradyrhizobium sp. ORS 86]|uniref:hypothetical protein n=1 Tax=Bradyrhizobium sp. ORS 86 TaxID=1685970 RepID=UPI0038904952